REPRHGAPRDARRRPADVRHRVAAGGLRGGRERDRHPRGARREAEGPAPRARRRPQPARARARRRRDRPARALDPADDHRGTGARVRGRDEQGGPRRRHGRGRLDGPRQPAQRAPPVTDEPTLADVRDTAREVFGYRDLRPGQREAITALLDGRDVLLVLPTGAGKSAVYQVPGLELPGPTLVVSPLIALQDRKSTRLNSSHVKISYAVFC